MVAYLDHDSEFYPDHLARVHALRDRGDVLLFRYDLVEERPGHPDLGTGYTHDSAARFHALDTETVAVPLGVAHRRALLATVGYFDETLGRHKGREEDADLWRRFARAGTKFNAVQAKSGLDRVRGTSLSRTRPPARGPGRRPPRGRGAGDRAAHPGHAVGRRRHRGPSVPRWPVYRHHAVPERRGERSCRRSDPPALRPFFRRQPFRRL